MTPRRLLWGGHEWDLKLTAAHKAGGVEAGVYLVPRVPPGLTGPADAAVAAVADVTAGAVKKPNRLLVYTKVNGTTGWGWPDLFGVGARPCWAAAAWRAAGVAGAGDVVRIKAVIGRML